MEKFYSCSDGKSREIQPPILFLLLIDGYLLPCISGIMVFVDPLKPNHNSIKSLFPLICMLRVCKWDVKSFLLYSLSLNQH